ncbi:hypothetical protein DRE_00351 [Drechslerella stenobrocha 248]|uniref:SRR1-like domain-containing protein n=1 Tax=Drechslerella stenobrocha 248 TaxID=1043628 RepID=W7I5C4_9PEZI|nr:hypothetical protein DRE_00351 [Drechslerella stenobrocha 248]
MRVENVLILALGSLSESTSPAPGYQLAAALAIIDVLKGSGDGGTAARLQILSYDPVYTRLDARILAAHGVVTVPASEIPTGEEWYRRAVVYMPHASVWLNHRYFVRQPGLWIGNSFAVYEAAVAGLRVGEEGGGSDVAAGELDVRNMLEEAGKVMREYERVEWPEEGWGGGAVFNNLVVYARRGGRSESAEEEGGLVEAVGGLKLE